MICSSGNRVDGRVRWKDDGVFVVIFIVVLFVLILAIALLVIKKRREALHSVAYHDDGDGEEDTFNHCIHHSMKYSHKDGHGTASKSVNGTPLDQMELLSYNTDGAGDMAEGMFYRLIFNIKIHCWKESHK